MTGTAATWRGVVNHYNKLPISIQSYFEHLPKLAESFPWDVCLAYQFARVERAHVMTLYCAAVKLHRAHPDLAWGAVQRQHLTRESFRDLYRTLVGHEVPGVVTAHIAAAEDTRDAIMHGKHMVEAKKRDAVVSVLEYARAFNDALHSHAGLKPFGPLQGFKGRAKSLDKSTTRWLLKGMGLAVA